METIKKNFDKLFAALVIGSVAFLVVRSFQNDFSIEDFFTNIINYFWYINVGAMISAVFICRNRYMEYIMTAIWIVTLGGISVSLLGMIFGASFAEPFAISLALFLGISAMIYFTMLMLSTTAPKSSF